MKSFKTFLQSIFFSGFAFFFLSCSTQVVLPQKQENMKAVYLLKYSTWGHHSLGFYENGVFTEYTYGDWQLYALSQRDFWTAWKNMTFTTQGALGCKSVKIKPGEHLLEKFVGCEAAVLFYAPIEKVNALKNRLKLEYLNEINSEIYNEKEELYFVKHHVSYWLFHNCNHELEIWLEALGAEVSGRVFYNPDFIGGMNPPQKAIEYLP